MSGFLAYLRNKKTRMPKLTINIILLYIIRPRVAPSPAEQKVAEKKTKRVAINRIKQGATRHLPFNFKL
jgi:hypothetical protein